jgi:hypothetical protein
MAQDLREYARYAAERIIRNRNAKQSKAKEDHMDSHVSWVDRNEKALERKLLADFSMDRVREHLQELTRHFRRAGTEGERKAASYIEDRLDQYGLENQVYEFDAYVSDPVSAELQLLSPGERVFPCLPRTFIPSTPPEGVEGELVSVGKGLAEDYRTADVRGKIILSRMGGIEDRVEASRLAQEKGALAQIFITMGESHAILTGQSRYTWGSPTPDTAGELSKIPALSVCREDGEYLEGLVKKERVRLKLKAEASTGYRKIRLPMGLLPGSKDPHKFVLVAGHYCSWFMGAVDNAVANAMMLEMARTFSTHRKSIKRSVRFAWWTGHEQGTYAGSTWYLDHFWDEIRDHAVAYLVMDGIARIHSSTFEIKNTEEIRSFQEAVSRDLLGVEVKSSRVTRIGDQSFWGVGVPSFLGRTGFSGAERRADGISHNWYDHTAEDTLDKIDMELIPMHFTTHAVPVLRLCNSAVLPFEFFTMAGEFKRALQERQQSDRFPVDLSPVIRTAEELEEQSKALNSRIREMLPNAHFGNRKVEAINRCLMALSRILLPVLSSRAGKYGQDPMGMKYRPIPGLSTGHEPSLSPETEQYKALYTSFVRERNRLSDALHAANALIRETLERT